MAHGKLANTTNLDPERGVMRRSGYRAVACPCPFYGESHWPSRRPSRLQELTFNLMLFDQASISASGVVRNIVHAFFIL